MVAIVGVGVGVGGVGGGGVWKVLRTIMLS